MSELPDTLQEQLSTKQLVFCVSPGRCGTKYLTHVLNSGCVPGLRAEHEPSPAFRSVLRLVQTDFAVGTRFWQNTKLPAIAKMDCSIYVETSHLFCEGFVEPLLELGVHPDIVAIHRPPREVALSMWKRRTFPGDGIMRFYHVEPSDPDVLLPIKSDYHQLGGYELCFWFALEMEARLRKYVKLFKELNVRVAETTTANLVTETGFIDVITTLGFADFDLQRYHTRCKDVVNKGNLYYPEPCIDSLEADVKHGIFAHEDSEVSGNTRTYVESLTKVELDI